jgi:hypothetical protein
MNVGITEITPVVFTGNAGGAGEYHASDDPNAPETHIVNVPVPAGANIVEAWYTPYHNIAALGAFALIDVNRSSTTQVKLKLAGYPGQNQRLRIKVTALYRV